MAILLLIFFVFLFGYSVLIEYYYKGWRSVPIHRADYPGDTNVSVVVAVRNEERNVDTLLADLAAQKYPKDKYEVILVDDHSTDSTFDEITGLADVGVKFIMVTLPDDATGKKKAIEAGVNVANGELILSTDADCRLPSTWIKSVVSFYEETRAKFIASPVMMAPAHNVRDVFQSLDFLTMQGITAAAVHRRFHMMCNGANVAYEKHAFFSVNGFEGIGQIPSGDDMLLMQKMFDRYPDKVVYLKSTDAVVTTRPEESWKKFLNQRVRWSSKAVHYTDKKIFYVLSLTYILNICFVILGIAAIIDLKWSSFLFLFLLAKILVEYPFVNSVAIFFGQQRLMGYFPFLQPVHIVYVVIAGWLGRFGSYEWKSRIVKNSGRGKLAKQ